MYFNQYVQDFYERHQHELNLSYEEFSGQVESWVSVVSDLVPADGENYWEAVYSICCSTVLAKNHPTDSIDVVCKYGILPAIKRK